MRDIEFRGIDEKTGKWAFGFYIRTPGLPGRTIIDGLAVGEDYQLLHDAIPETVGQYTGLKDKNGVKIFEGDIVKSTDGATIPAFLYLVEWLNNDFNFGYYAGGSGGHRTINSHFLKCYECEVIGNIHDSPELLHANNS